MHSASSPLPSLLCPRPATPSPPPSGQVCGGSSPQAARKYLGAAGGVRRRRGCSRVETPAFGGSGTAASRPLTPGPRWLRGAPARPGAGGGAGRRVWLGPSDWGRAARGELSGIGSWESREEPRARGPRGVRGAGGRRGRKWCWGTGAPPALAGSQEPRGGGRGAAGQVTAGGRERLTRGGRRPDLHGAGPQVVSLPFLVAFLFLLPLLLGGDLYSLPPPPDPPPSFAAALALGLREL